MQTLRYWDYYGMTETFTDLYDKSSKQKSFSHLYDIITSRENILLSYRTVKSNKGSNTPGTDGKTIKDIQKLSDDVLIEEIRNKLKHYHPKKVRRKLIGVCQDSCRIFLYFCVLNYKELLPRFAWCPSH